MRACLLAATALMLLASTGCHGLNLSRHAGHRSAGTCQACNQQAAQAQLAPAPAAYNAAPAGYAAAPVNYGEPVAYGYGPYNGPAYGGAYGGACPGGHCGHGHHGGYGHGYGGPLHFGTRGAHGFPHHHQAREYTGPQGPPTAQVAYPYYTIRGPRDFLMNNPPSIGR